MSTPEAGAAYDNTPLTLDQAFEHAPIYLGFRVAELGEDGESCLIPAHTLATDRVGLVLMEADVLDDLADFDEVDVEQAWVVFTPHSSSCSADRGSGEAQGCTCGDEYAWWVKRATAETPGAVPVTWWSV